MCLVIALEFYKFSHFFIVSDLFLIRLRFVAVIDIFGIRSVPAICSLSHFSVSTSGFAIGCTGFAVPWLRGFQGPLSVNRVFTLKIFGM